MVKASATIGSFFTVFTLYFCCVNTYYLNYPYGDEVGQKKEKKLSYQNIENQLAKQWHNEESQIWQPNRLSNTFTPVVHNTHNLIRRNLTKTPVLVENWPESQYEFGQITAVSVDPNGNPVILHRADRQWNDNSFNETNNMFYYIEYGPIQEATIYILKSTNGDILTSWGKNFFYMPHGMTIDVYGNYWITDVAMHQAFKFKPFQTEPLITIGIRFQPGSSTKHLCQPTSTAVATTGEFFIADGYCNERILKFNAAGRLLRIIPQPPEFLSLFIPHAITLLEHLDLLCIADRENMRVVCPKAGLKSSQTKAQPATTIQEPDLGRVFGIASYGNIVYAVNGPTSMLPVHGFTINPLTESIIARWGNFKTPHSIAVCINGTALYVTEIGYNYTTNRIWKYALV